MYCINITTNKYTLFFFIGKIVLRPHKISRGHIVERNAMRTYQIKIAYYFSGSAGRHFRADASEVYEISHISRGRKRE